MQPSLFTLCSVIVLAGIVDAFRGRQAPLNFLTRSKGISSKSKMSMMMQPTEFLTTTQSLLTAAVAEAKPDDYVYGAVNAPSWALPLGAVFAIITAAVPFLLRPGEKALDQQRIDEETTNNQFGKRRGKDL